MSFENMITGQCTPSLATVMVVGYGNTLRRDDGIGQVVAPELARLLRERGRKAAFLTAHQLVPEMALDIAEGNYDVVVFVDASVTCPPAKWDLSTLEFGSSKAVSDPHKLSPVALMEMVCMLKEDRLKALMISCGASDFSLGEGFSEEMSAILDCLEEMAEAVLDSLSGGSVAG